MPALNLPPPGSRPLSIDVMRGPAVESRHAVHCVIVDGGGRVVAAWGDPDRPTFPRSACKPIQQMPLAESGAIDAFGLSEAELALACSSHSAEPRHVDLVGRWLRRIGLAEADLECGRHWPYHEPTAHAMMARAENPTQLHNNCSGKHTGFLTLARHMGWSTAGYIEVDHPVQRAVTGSLSDLMGFDLATAPLGRDGCGIPTMAAPLVALARGMARMASGAGLSPGRAAAARRLLAAMAAEPQLVAGTGRFDTALMSVTDKRISTKGGAEGVHVAAVPERGIGIALKAEDGAGRAADLAMAAVLAWLDLLDEGQRARLADLLVAPIRNRAGLLVGEIHMGPVAF